MRLLALETATEPGSCALWQDGQLLERQCPAGRSSSETLLLMVKELLVDAGVSIGQLDGIAFGAGPGAFTGLRVACAIAQGLAVAADLPVVPVLSLEAMALEADAPSCLAVLDARMGEVYWAQVVLSGGQVNHGDSIRLSPPDQVVFTEGVGVIAGNALLAYPILAAKATRANWRSLPDILPQARAVACLAAPRLAAGQGIDPALALPYYVRNKVAQTIAERLAGGGKA